MYILAGPIIHCLLRACVYKLNYVYIYVCYWSFSAHAMLRSRKGTCYTSRMSRTAVSRPGRLYPLRLYTTTHSPTELSYVSRTSQCAEWVSRREQVIVVLLFSGNKNVPVIWGRHPFPGVCLALYTTLNTVVLTTLLILLPLSALRKMLLSTVHQCHFKVTV